MLFNTMSRHKCDATKCPKKCISGPKIKCCKCDRLCYLQCYDFEAGTKIDGLETVKLSSNGMVISTFISTLAFSCCTDTLSPAEQKVALKMPSTGRSSSQGRPPKKSEGEQLFANEIETIKDMLTSIKEATAKNTAEIAEIKSTTAKTDACVQKATEQNTLNLMTPNNTAPAMSYVAAFHGRAAARAAQTPSSSKRKRTSSPNTVQQKPKPNFPAPKMGTKVNVNGLSVVSKPIRNRDDKPKYEKALYVSGLDPSTTNEQITEYIVENTSVDDKDKFNVHKMVKKDADITTLKYVSFKVELNVDELIVLDDVSLWPEGVRVREFKQVPKNELGRHFPSLPTKEQLAATNTTNLMETDGAT